MNRHLLHCGAPNNTCTEETCLGGVCQSVPIVATGLNSPGALAVDQHFVYFITTGDNSVMKVEKVGGTAVPLATGQPGVRHLALDTDFVYFTNSLGAAVMRVSKAGGMPELVSAAQEPAAIAVDSDAVYWANMTDRKAMRIDKSLGSAAMPIVNDVSSEIIVDGAYLYFSNTAIYRVLKTGGVPELVPMPGTASAYPPSFSPRTPTISVGSRPHEGSRLSSSRQKRMEVVS